MSLDFKSVETPVVYVDVSAAINHCISQLSLDIASRTNGKNGSATSDDYEFITKAAEAIRVLAKVQN